MACCKDLGDYKLASIIETGSWLATPSFTRFASNNVIHLKTMATVILLISANTMQELKKKKRPLSLLGKV